MNGAARGILLTLAFVCSGSAVADNDLADPSDLLEATAGRIFTTLNENYHSYSEHPELLRDLVRHDLLPLLDIRYSARLILGRTGRGATDDQLDRFAQAMSDLLVDRYSTGLLRFRSKEQIQVLPMKGRIDPRMTRVRTRVRLDSGGFAPVDYVFRMTDEGWKAFDLIVEGISYVTTYRNQIMPEVQADGLESVIARLTNGDLDLNS
jgi:phospholipid transport system substrate-binding protein